MRVAFFTAGDLGAGHVARGIAIERALARAKFDRTFRMFGPEPVFAATHSTTWTSVAIEESELSSAALAPASALARALRDFDPDLVLVDMFWAPLRYVLPTLRAQAWLLLRSFPPTWLLGPPGVPFEASQYERIVAIEPVESPAITHAIDPVVVLNPDERQPRGALRRRLGVREDERLVGVVHAGNRDEHRELVPALQRGERLFVSNMFENGALFPIAGWLDDCDRIHAGAGYNTYWEARWLEYAARTTFTPFRRRNDDQIWRLRAGSHHVMRANGADTLAGWIMGRLAAAGVRRIRL